MENEVTVVTVVEAVKMQTQHIITHYQQDLKERTDRLCDFIAQQHPSLDTEKMKDEIHRFTATAVGEQMLIEGIALCQTGERSDEWIASVEGEVERVVDRFTKVKETGL